MFTVFPALSDGASCVNATLGPRPDAAPAPAASATRAISVMIPLRPISVEYRMGLAALPHPKGLARSAHCGVVARGGSGDDHAEVETHHIEARQRREPRSFPI